MTSDNQDTQESNSAQGSQDTSSQENNTKSSDAQLLLQSKEKMKKVEGSHMNFSEAAKNAKEQKKTVELNESNSTEQSSNESNDD
jgi:hypothetical protein